MVRDAVTSQTFGISPVSDAFWLAFKVPNLTRRLFGEGAMTAAFLPAFSRELTHGEGRPTVSAWRLASAVFVALATLLLALVLAGETLLWIGSVWFVDSPYTRLLLGLTAVMLPYSCLICLAAQMTAVLHALGHFTVPALVPIVLNVCWISTIWFVDPWFEPDREAQAYALATCVVATGLLQVGMQWPALVKQGFRIDLRLRETWPRVCEIGAGMLPVLFGLSVEQISTLCDGLIAWCFSDPGDGSRLALPGQPAFPLQAGAVSALYLGERLYQFPMGVFGGALGTVLFPLFARHAARGEIDRLRDDLSLGLRLVMAIGIPASIGLMLVSLPLTRVLLEHGRFTSADAERTSALIAAYGSGVWAFCAMPILARGFFAVGDRVAPVRVGLFVLIFDTVLNLSLIWPFAERGLAYSTSVSAIMQAWCLWWLLQRRIGRFDNKALWRTTLRTLAATAAMAIAHRVALWPIPQNAGSLWNIAALVLPLIAAIAAYFAAAHFVGLREPWLLLHRGSDTASDDTETASPECGTNRDASGDAGG